jgi:hypothetical protein
MWRGEIGRIAILLVVCLGINAVLSHWYTDTVMATNLIAKGRSQFARAPDRIDTLLVGDSHMMFGIRASKLENAFNLAVPGQMYTETFYTVKSYLAREDIDVRTVVINADPSAFEEARLENWIYQHEYVHYVDYLRIGADRGKISEYAAHHLIGRHAPYVGNRKFNLQYLEKQKVPLAFFMSGVKMELGSALTPHSLLDIPEARWSGVAAYRAAQTHADGDPFNPVAMDYFDRILQLCADEGIQVLVVKFPLTPVYLNAVASFVDLDEFDARLDALIGSYPNVQLMDARSLYSERLEYFSNHDHLNRKGSTRFARKVRARLESLRARRGQS